MTDPLLAKLMDPKRAMGGLDRRGRLLEAAFGLAVLFFFIWSDHRAATLSRPVVIAALRAKGFPDAKVRRAVWTLDCGRHQTGFRWIAATARGSACADKLTPDDVAVFQSTSR